jgi:hypothetical protein
MTTDSKGRVLCTSCGKPIKLDDLGSILPGKENNDKPRLYHKGLFCTFQVVDDIEEMEKQKVKK